MPKMNAPPASSSAEQAREPQRRDRERGQSLDRQPDQRIQVPAGAAVRALRRLVVDPDLPEADPAREPLEEAVALGQLPQRRGGARREQAEVAGVLGDLLPRAPVDQAVEHLHALAPQPGLVLAMRLGGVDHVVAVIEPMADTSCSTSVGRMLAVAVHEQHGAEARVVEPGEQRRLLAEIARQRDHLDVERLRRQPLRDAERGVAAAVVDIDDLGREAARLAQAAGDLDEPVVQGGKPVGLVEHRHHDRQAELRPARGHAPGSRWMLVGLPRWAPCSWPFERISPPFRGFIAQRRPPVAPAAVADGMVKQARQRARTC